MAGCTGAADGRRGFPDYPPLSIFYAGSYKGFTADYLALVFERPLRVRDFPSRQVAIDALSQGEIDLLGVGSEVEARQHGLLASAAYLSDRPVLVSSSGAQFDSQAESWLATVKGYLPAERIKAAYPHSRIIWFDSPQLALEALSMGMSMACWGRSFHALPHPDPLPAELAHRELRTHRQPGFPFPAPAR